MQRELEPVPREQQNFCARARSVTINTKKFFFSLLAAKKRESAKKNNLEARRRPILLWPRAHRIESNKLSPLAPGPPALFIRVYNKVCGKVTFFAGNRRKCSRPARACAWQVFPSLEAVDRARNAKGIRRYFLCIFSSTGTEGLGTQISALAYRECGWLIHVGRTYLKKKTIDV